MSLTRGGAEIPDEWVLSIPRLPWPAGDAWSGPRARHVHAPGGRQRLWRVRRSRERVVAQQWARAIGRRAACLPFFGPVVGWTVAEAPARSRRHKRRHTRVSGPPRPGKRLRLWPPLKPPPLNGLPAEARDDLLPRSCCCRSRLRGKTVTSPRRVPGGGTERYARRYTAS